MTRTEQIDSCIILSAFNFIKTVELADPDGCWGLHALEHIDGILVHTQQYTAHNDSAFYLTELVRRGLVRRVVGDEGQIFYLSNS